MPGSPGGEVQSGCRLEYFAPPKLGELPVQFDLPAGFEVNYTREFTGNAFLREALSLPAQQVAQYLGFSYRTGIDEGIVAAIPNIGPHPAL